MISGNTEVCRSGFDHRQHRPEYTANGTNLLPVCVLCGRNREEISEQLVGAVDEMNVHQVNSKCSLLRAAYGAREQGQEAATPATGNQT